REAESAAVRAQRGLVVVVSASTSADAALTTAVQPDNERLVAALPARGRGEQAVLEPALDLVVREGVDLRRHECSLGELPEHDLRPVALLPQRRGLGERVLEVEQHIASAAEDVQLG